MSIPHPHMETDVFKAGKRRLSLSVHGIPIGTADLPHKNFSNIAARSNVTSLIFRTPFAQKDDFHRVVK